MRGWHPDDPQVTGMSYYQLVLNYSSIFAARDHIWDHMIKPFAEYIIMFINSEGLKEFKEFEKGGHSQVDSLDQALGKKNVRGVETTPEGNIIGHENINVYNVLAELEKTDSKYREVDISGQGLF